MKLVRLWLRLFATASVIVGPLCGLFAIGFSVHTAVFLRHASRTDGTITKLTSYKDAENTETFAPTFTFETKTGETVTKESTTRSNPPGFEVGAHVPVLFDPNDAQHAEINTTGQLWFVPILLSCFFVVLTTVGILLLRNPQVRTAPIPFFSMN